MESLLDVCYHSYPRQLEQLRLATGSLRTNPSEQWVQEFAELEDPMMKED